MEKILRDINRDLVYAEFRKIFTETSVECLSLIEKHIDEKGDSWKACSIEYLRDKLMEEYNEWLISWNKDSEEKREILDIINMCVMLKSRLTKCTA